MNKKELFKKAFLGFFLLVLGYLVAIFISRVILNR